MTKFDELETELNYVLNKTFEEKVKIQKSVYDINDNVNDRWYVQVKMAGHDYLVVIENPEKEVNFLLYHISDLRKFNKEFYDWTDKDIYLTFHDHIEFRQLEVTEAYRFCKTMLDSGYLQSIPNT